MPICASCGADNRESARFCDACGAALVAPPPAREQRKVVTVLFCDVTGSTELGERLDPESLRALLTAAHGRMQWQRKLVAAEKALDYAERADDERRASLLLPQFANARYFGPTRASEIISWLDSQRTRHPSFEVHGAQSLAMLGRVEEARAAHDLEYAHRCELGAAVPIAISCNIRAEIELMIGDAAAAEDWGRQACEQMEEMGHVSWLSTMEAQRGHALFELGRDDEAFEAAERGRELGADDDLATQMHRRRVEAKVLARRGEAERAEELAREAVALCEATDMVDAQGDSWADLGEVLELVGEPDEAAEAFRVACERFERKENLLMLGRTRARLESLSRA